jgi:hypothetical protein
MPLYNHSDILSESNTQIESDYPHRKPPEVAVTMDLETEQEPERMIIIDHIRYKVATYFHDASRILQTRLGN